jgi:hypothetical protein
VEEMNARVIINGIDPSNWEIHSGGSCDMVARININDLGIKSRVDMIKALADSLVEI